MKLFSAYAAKAQLAGLIAGITVIVAGLEADNGLTAYEVGSAVLAYLVALGGVYSVSNKPGPVA